MPIRFRCTHCQGLMAISSRQAGAIVDCPTCGEKTLVPQEDSFSLSPSPPSPPPSRPPSPPPEVDQKPVPPKETTPAPPRPKSPEDLEKAAKPIVRAESNEQQQPKELLVPKESTAGPPEWEDGAVFVPSEIGDDGGDAPLVLRRHRNLDEEMDLTPMVDVTFQLLIFFMVSASFSLQKSIEVPIPDPDQKGATQQVQTLDELQGTSILVRIDASNGIWIDDEPLGNVHKIADTLRDKMRREQKTELLLSADSQSLHRTIIAVIDAANEIGIQKIRMATKKKSDS